MAVVADAFSESRLGCEFMVVHTIWMYATRSCIFEFWDIDNFMYLILILNSCQQSHRLGCRIFAGKFSGSGKMYSESQKIFGKLFVSSSGWCAKVVSKHDRRCWVFVSVHVLYIVFLWWIKLPFYRTNWGKIQTKLASERCTEWSSLKHSMGHQSRISTLSEIS